MTAFFSDLVTCWASLVQAQVAASSASAARPFRFPSMQLAWLSVGDWLCHEIECWSLAVVSKPDLPGLQPPMALIGTDMAGSLAPWPQECYERLKWQARTRCWYALQMTLSTG